MLLVGAGLLIRTVQALVSTDQGFRRDHLLTVTLHLPEAKYPKRQQYADFSRQLLDRTAALPGVTSASLASGLPMQNLQVQSYGIDGAPRPEPPPMTDVRTVDENYFRTMGIPVTLGRNFTRQETDDEKSSVIIINQAMAKKIAAGQDPLSKRLSMHDRKWEVIGVVGDAAQLGPETPINPEVYFPSRAYREMTMVVRTTLEPTQLASPISRAVSAIDNEQPVSETATMEEALKGWTGEKRFVMVLLATFAALALLLAAAGIYGVLAYSVSQRTREIGIRMAIGATAGDVLKMIVREGFILTAIGLAIGLAGAFALTRLLQGLVFGVSTTDAASFIGAIAVLGIASLAASWLPARRAAKLEPLTALRDE
jgi:putative ABC transport system permease protein